MCLAEVADLEVQGVTSDSQGRTVGVVLGGILLLEEDIVLDMLSSNVTDPLLDFVEHTWKLLSF